MFTLVECRGHYDVDRYRTYVVLQAKCNYFEIYVCEHGRIRCNVHDVERALRWYCWHVSGIMCPTPVPKCSTSAGGL